MSFDNTSKTIAKAEFLMTQLGPATYKTHILPALAHNLLMSIKILADNGYTTIFHPYDKELTAYNNINMQIIVTKEVLLQG